MHLAVARFIEKVEADARSIGKKRFKINHIEIAFLEEVFGPEFNYDFEGLEPQFPFKDYKDGNRFVDFIYRKGVIKIIIEIDGLTWHVTHISTEEFDDHQERQNDLLLSGGYLLLRFTANMVQKKPMLCRRQLMQAVGRCYTSATSSVPLDVNDIWSYRKHAVKQLADKTTRLIKPADLAAEFNITRRTAVYWLQRLSKEGYVLPVKKDKRIVGYKWVNR
ncbi:DUF559 domain-containing protein [Paenibacillus alkalitolerans]|uniref:DUF559 domain-containing protein n=1 Tax=Paenibacillus alkalitolerans TaxID=2799335 RepID=UPI0018F5D061|nr:DUF559 domain-containing protein [Paenibacillus alkalitolerans]